jgi:hypothetical protein
VKPGDIVRFVEGVGKMKAQGSTLPWATCVGIVIKKVSHVEDLWIVNFPRIGGIEGYPSSWFEVVSEI